MSDPDLKRERVVAELRKLAGHLESEALEVLKGEMTVRGGELVDELERPTIVQIEIHLARKK